jgi:hypothetical protein
VAVAAEVTPARRLTMLKKRIALEVVSEELSCSLVEGCVGKNRIIPTSTGS